jgi:hypothetical protein
LYALHSQIAATIATMIKPGPDACVVLPSGSESQARHDPTAKRSGNKTQNDAYTNVTELIGQPHA